MSYITTMVLCEGIIMSADRQITQRASTRKIDVQMANNIIEQQISNLFNQELSNLDNLFKRPLTRTAKKLFTMGDNIGIAMGQTMFTNNNYIPVSLYVEHFCRNNNFDNPKEAAEKLLEYLRQVDSTINTTLFIAGYNKSDLDTLSGVAYYVKVKENKYGNMKMPGFNYAGANDYFSDYSNKINTCENILKYTLQDAVNICKLATDICRGLERYIDFNEAISDDIEMIAITKDGIQWLKKAELAI